MKRPGPRATSLLIALPLFGFSSACATWHDDYWSFPVSRDVYGSRAWAETDDGPREHEYSADPRQDETHGIHGGGSEAWIVPFILILPVAIDLVLLPVTATHDFFFVD